MVSDPEHIKRIEASGDVDRLHTYSSRALPWWVRFYFRATKFYDEERDLWFLPFESTSDPSYAGRRSFVEEIFTSHAPTPQVPRIAIRSSTFGGLLLFPTRPAKTVVIFKIGKAAAKTNDLLFTFSTGRPERACVFQGFFLAFMRDLQKALRQMENPDR